MDELEEIRKRKFEELSGKMPVKGDGEVIQRADELAHSILASTAYKTFMATQQRLETDPQAKRLIAEFQNTQQTLQFIQTSGGNPSMDEIQKLRTLQQKMVEYPAIKSYIEAQQNLNDLVQSIYLTLSTKTGLNFGGSGGCCG